MDGVRGTYVTLFGGLTEITALDRAGRLLKRVQMPSTLVHERDIMEVRVFLEGADPLAPAVLTPWESGP